MARNEQAGSFQTSDDCTITFRLRPAAQRGAPRLALIHPLGLSGAVWEYTAMTLAKHAELLTYDCRGHGQSERRASPYTTALFARDLTELFDHIGWPTASVAGCSMGGCVAQAFAGAYPERLELLCLIDTTAWYGPEAPMNWRQRAAMARTKGMTALVDFQGTRWFSDQFREQYPDVLSEISDIFRANDVDCYSETCIMLGDTDLRPLLKSITAPAAIVVGEDDYATPVSMSRQLHEAIAGSSLKIIPGVRHLTPVEIPQEICSEILKLLKRTGEAPASPSVTSKSAGA